MARSHHVDRTIRKFLEHHPMGTIVNLGCGLDTTFERVDNRTLTFDLDLPDVIALRKQYIREQQRRSFITMSANTMGRCSGSTNDGPFSEFFYSR